jgi:hypothetical protein
MARPKKNTADYFPHLCNHGKKMSYIERRHGNDGYAVWYKILEKLAQANDHYLHLEDDIEADFLADYCLVDMDKLMEILKDLVKVGALDSEAWESKVVYSWPLIDSLSDLYTRRKDKPAELNQIIDRVKGVSVYINSHSIVKDSIEEKSIEEERRGFHPITLLISELETICAINSGNRKEVVDMVKQIPEELWPRFIERCKEIQGKLKSDGLSPYKAINLIPTAMQSLDAGAEKDWVNNIQEGDLSW